MPLYSILRVDRTYAKRAKATLQPNIHLWPASRVAEAAINAGLFGWLADRML
jgi:hypothetical protein